VIYDISAPTEGACEKSRVLKQLAAAFGLPYLVTSLTADDLTEFFSMVAVNLFERTFPEGVIDAIEVAWPHLSLVYTALNASFSLHKTQEAIGPCFIDRLVKNTVSFDGREREASARSLLKLHETYARFHDTILKSVYWLIMQSLCSDELLDFLMAIIPGFAVPLRPPELAVCLDAILHVFMLPRIFPRLVPTVLRVLNKSPDLFPDTVSCLLYHWPLTAPAKQIFYLNALAKLFAVFPGYGTHEIARAVFRAVAQAIPSVHVDTAFAAIGFLKDESLRQLLQVYPESVGEVLDALDAVKSHWDEDARGEAGFVFATLSRYRRTPLPTYPVQSEKNWQLILAMAQRRDRSIRRPDNFLNI
jgi:hypothetical protein